MANIKLADILKALAQRLQNNAGILAIVGDSEHIKNHLPQDQTLPYVRFGISGNIEWDCKDSTGFDGKITIDCWSDEHGDLQVLELIDACMTAIDNIPLTLPVGQKMVLFQHENNTTFIEPDGHTHHAIITFRHLSYGG